MKNVLDDSWVKSAFWLPTDQLIGGNEAIVNRIYSTSMQKATDTTPGGNFVINPLCQFTRYADLKHNVFGSRHAKGNSVLIPRVNRSNSTNPNLGNGMGRVYSEKYDDNMQVVHFRMGFPEFNSLTSFYANYYSVPAASMARQGKAPGFFYQLGWAMGSVATIPLMPFIFVAKTVRFFLSRPASKYYYMTPNMFPYWSAVSSMVNGIAAQMGVIPKPIANFNRPLFEKDDGLEPQDIENFHRLIPSIYRRNGGIDVYAVAQRAQALVNARREQLEGELNKVNNAADMKALFKKRLYGEDLGSLQTKASNSLSTYEEYSKRWSESEFLGKIPPADESNTSSQNKVERMKTGYIDQFQTALKSEMHMGSEFLSVRVDFTGTQTESFSNSTKEPQISTQINSMSSSARETRFSMFDGNIDSGGIAQAALGAFKDVVSGAAQGFGIQGLAQLAGSAFVDIPKVWDSSSCDFNKISLNIPLRTPYGDPISRLQNLIMPMCCFFAMAVPLATGKQSHTSPFLIEFYSQGRAQSRLAMVDSLSMTRGVGDVGWNNNGGFLGVDVQLSLIDLTNAINMPLNPSAELSDRIVQGAGYAIDEVLGYDERSNVGAGIASAFLGSTYDDDNSYSEYLAILAGTSLEHQINPVRKWALRLARQQASFDDAISPNRAAMWAGSTLPGEVWKAFTPPADRL